LLTPTLQLISSNRKKVGKKFYAADDREAMYIGLTMGFTVSIFLVWILAGLMVPSSYQVISGAIPPNGQCHIVF
jgi:hypothetical protein